MKTNSSIFPQGKSPSIALFVMILSLASCSSMELLYKYETYAMPSDSLNLVFSDSLMEITFDPQPNGISFQIENLTNSNLFLNWDEAYFITPNGNSSKALNTDILKTNDKLAEKGNYESIIPSKSKFRRFTTPITNLYIFEDINIDILYNDLLPSMGSVTTYNKFFSSGQYWPTQVTHKYSSASDREEFITSQFKKLESMLKDQDELGMGFTLRQGNFKREYHFKIKFKKIIVYIKDSASGTSGNYYILREITTR